MSAITEISDALAALAALYTSQNQYILTGSTELSPSTVVSDIEVAELVTFAKGEAERGAGFEIGVAQEAISISSAILREVDIALLKKSSIYSNIANNASTEALFYNQSKDYYIGVIKGNPTSGSQS